MALRVSASHSRSPPSDSAFPPAPLASPLTIAKFMMASVLFCLHAALVSIAFYALVLHARPLYIALTATSSLAALFVMVPAYPLIHFMRPPDSDPTSLHHKKIFGLELVLSAITAVLAVARSVQGVKGTNALIQDFAVVPSGTMVASLFLTLAICTAIFSLVGLGIAWYDKMPGVAHVSPYPYYAEAQVRKPVVPSPPPAVTRQRTKTSITSEGSGYPTTSTTYELYHARRAQQYA